MRKLFFAICFNLIICQAAVSRVTQISGLEALPPIQKNDKAPKITKIDEEDFKIVVEEGFSNAKVVNPEIIDKNFDYVGRQEDEEKKKSIFEEMYEQAISRISKDHEEPRADVITPQILKKMPVAEQQQQWKGQGIPTVMAALPPDDTVVEIPAMEHIPYLMNFIEVLPTGLVKFEETVVIVANGEKLQRGLTKILPIYIYNNEKKRQKLDYSIMKVTVNDTPIEYKITTNGENVLLVPLGDYKLDPGIYTYKFDYVVDNLLWQKEGAYQFYWDIGGNGWNLVVDRLGAIFNLPQTEALVSQNVLLGSAAGVSLNAVNIAPNGPTAYSYIARRPLFIGEGMPLIA